MVLEEVGSAYPEIPLWTWVYRLTIIEFACKPKLIFFLFTLKPEVKLSVRNVTSSTKYCITIVLVNVCFKSETHLRAIKNARFVLISGGTARSAYY